MNQLTNVVTKLGATNLLANRYDGLGRRVQATTGGTTIVRYVYLPGTFLILATLDGANNLLETFTHGPDLSGTLGGAGGIGGILSQTKHQGPTTTHFLHPASMGNVILTTDESGAVSSTYRYTPFGRPYAKTGPFTSRFTYSSKEFDGATGLGYWGYRFYSPGLGRWLSRDPIEESGGLNMYGFVENDGINMWDNCGLYPGERRGRDCPEGQHSCPRAKHEPGANGCGPGGWKNELVPNRPFGLVDYTEACNTHDKCYDRCNSDRKDCDDDFLAAMRAKCSLTWGRSMEMPRNIRLQSFSGIRVPRPPRLRLPEDPRLEACYTTAQLYYEAVKRGGRGPYRAAQENACICCDQCPL